MELGVGAGSSGAACPHPMWLSSHRAREELGSISPVSFPSTGHSVTFPIVQLLPMFCPQQAVSSMEAGNLVSLLVPGAWRIRQAINTYGWLADGLRRGVPGVFPASLHCLSFPSGQRALVRLSLPLGMVLSTHQA